MKSSGILQGLSFHPPPEFGYISKQFSLVPPFGSLPCHLKYLTGSKSNTHIHLSESQSVAPNHALFTLASETYIVMDIKQHYLKKKKKVTRHTTFKMFRKVKVFTVYLVKIVFWKSYYLPFNFDITQLFSLSSSMLTRDEPFDRQKR